MTLRRPATLATIAALAALLAATLPASADVDPLDPLNVDIADFCNCFKIQVDKIENPTKYADVAPPVIAFENGKYTFTLDVSVSPDTSCENVKISSIKIGPAKTSDNSISVDPPSFNPSVTSGSASYNGSVTITEGMVKASNTSEWMITVTATPSGNGLLPVDKEYGCTYPITLGGCDSCSNCGSGAGTGQPQVSN
ncbi:MAG: hypothetical protein NTV46_22135, partial [Verrucomicrobia bacterium]|nr:hypothetical protein [Verrucomicrobiota bacterium]